MSSWLLLKLALPIVPATAYIKCHVFQLVTLNEKKSKIGIAWYVIFPVSSRLDIILAWQFLFCIGQITSACHFNTWPFCMLAALKTASCLNTGGHEKLLSCSLTVLRQQWWGGQKSVPCTLLKSVQLKSDSPWITLLVSWGLTVFPALLGFCSWSGLVVNFEISRRCFLIDLTRHSQTAINTSEPRSGSCEKKTKMALADHGNNSNTLRLAPMASRKEGCQ